jgi:outer membrane protein OmpA-like peptidoglycan-associated protein
MLLTLDRKDSYGQRDVYVSFQRNDGSWSEPKNLGPVVNSYDDETSPFLAADGVSLYYSTEGFPGYGSQDIFVSRRLDDTWEHWSPPQNLGPEINSDDWDAYYTIPASGEYAYVVSAQNSIGATDIFEIKLAETAKPKPVVLVKGRVFNSKTKQPLESQISYSDLSTNKEAGVARSDAKDGSYQIVLPLEKIYSFVGAKSGFYPISDTVNVKDVKSYQEITRDLYLSPIEVKQAIRLNNIFFDFDKTELLSESSAELDRLVALLKQQPAMRIELRGHTDNKGADAYNQKLSDGRATAVLEYLAGKGIDRNRMVAKGYGKTVPIASNDTEAGRAQNRRVEFMILEL